MRFEVHGGTLAANTSTCQASHERDTRAQVRRLLLWMSRNNWMRRHLPNLWFTRRAVRRFMPGETAAEALDAAAKFKETGTGVLFTRLGETLTGIDDGDETADAYLRLMADAKARRHRRRSVGEAHSAQVRHRPGSSAQPHATARRSCRGADCLDRPVEGSEYTEPTLSFYERLKKTHQNAGLCLQAYLKRTYWTSSDWCRSTRDPAGQGAYAEPRPLPTSRAAR